MGHCSRSTSASSSTFNIELVWLLLYLFGTLFLISKLCFCHGDDLEARCIEEERVALVQFKDSLTDPSRRLSSWVGQDCCKWEGVICSNRTGRVVQLKLHNPSSSCKDCYFTDYKAEGALGGKINQSLLVLKDLNYLDLSMNNFGYTQIPSFIGSLPKLRYLNLSGAFFSGTIPPTLGNLSRLTHLDLNNEVILLTYYLNFTNLACFGKITSFQWLSHLTSFKYLDLGGWKVTKEVAAYNWLQTIHTLPSLLELHMSYCGLSSLPLSFPLVNFTSLSLLDLSGNYFNSTIPQWLFNLKSLVHLDLSYNNFHGALPEVRNSQNLCNLRTLVLSSNRNISGEITDLVDSLSSCSDLRIETLDLGFNSLSGNLPSSLGHLKSLKCLSLYHNSFQGSIINSIGNLTSLEQLYLSYNTISTVTTTLDVITEAHFANLSRLKELTILEQSPNVSLVFNISSVWVPPFKLRHLHIMSCQLGPKFPAWLKNQNELLSLTLNHAGISDSLPNWFGQPDWKLEELDIAYNNISGGVPDTLKLKNCWFVDLGSNHFDGPLPLISLKIKVLYLSSNQFSGPIPSNIGEAMPLLRDLDISRNSLNGSIPFSIGNLNKLVTLVISNNHLSGQIPNIWENMSSLKILDMSNNHLSGIMPRSMGSLCFEFLIISNNSLSGKLPSFLKSSSKGLKSLDLGDNKFSGKLPTWLGESMPNLLILRLRSNFFFGNIPLQLCHLSNLHVLDLSYNNLSSHIPHCIGNLTGMKTELIYLLSDAIILTGDVEKIFERISNTNFPLSIRLVSSLDLSNNNLSGTIPSSIGHLSFLKFLVLSNNTLSGELPSTLKNCSNLVSLDLGENKFSGKLPAWIGESMPNLLILRLRSNLFTGSIPSEFCGLSNLHILDLSNNKLSDHIPHCIGNLSGMKSKLADNDTLLFNGSFKIVAKRRVLEYKYSVLSIVNSLDLSNNNLSGEMPAELTNLVKLIALNLSMNHLTGKIPMDIGNLKRLETLDLSMNNFSGPIPLSMPSLTFLNHFNVSYNNLSGKIPTANQFQTFHNPSIYQGNVGLCGKPLQNDCSDSSQNSPPGKDKEDKDGNVGKAFENLGLFISIALGFIVGFWGVFGTLILKKSWRGAYFGFIERVSDTCFLFFHRMFAYRNEQV